MSYHKLVNQLGYNPKYFAYYVAMRRDLGITETSLEDILLESEEEMAKFCSAPFEYEKDFVRLFDGELGEYLSYLTFCKRSKLFPFSEEFVSEARKCNNCAFPCITKEGDLFCGEEYVHPDNNCYGHVFNVNYFPEHFGR